MEISDSNLNELSLKTLSNKELQEIEGGAPWFLIGIAVGIVIWLVLHDDI